MPEEEEEETGPIESDFVLINRFLQSLKTVNL